MPIAPNANSLELRNDGLDDLFQTRQVDATKINMSWMTYELCNALMIKLHNICVIFADKLKGTKEYYGIPMLPEPSKAKDPEQRFLLVGLNVTKEKSITLALDVNNVYVVGYLDAYQDRYRAHVFSDASEVAKDSLWKDAKERLLIKYPSSYGGIEGKDNPRQKVELGIEKLKFAILSVFGKQQIKENLEAKLLLLSVQMVSEATRFKYIEKMILNSIERKGTYKSFFPNPLVISLENGWQDLSKGVRNSNKGVISRAVQLIDPNNKPFKVDKVQANPQQGSSAMAICLIAFGAFSYGMYQFGKSNKSISIMRWKSYLGCLILIVLLMGHNSVFVVYKDGRYKATAKFIDCTLYLSFVTLNKQKNVLIDTDHVGYVRQAIFTNILENGLLKKCVSYDEEKACISS
ncbi:unnamed protein product [Dovyalis caffra]|uniref:Uncharacterized protein n=1 Tax=Dovyalis caffra TaxID=77055 RepID=A0AAV1RX51_9ROSI|nr:unnamed protein product [Dovyalis caffra]